MSVFPYVVAVLVFLVGIAGIATSRHLIHLIVCLGVAQSGTYVLLLAIGWRSHGTAPIRGSAPAGSRQVDPVVQALALTDIVVGVTVSALLLALAIQVHRRRGTMNPDELRTLRG
ncbi:MAG TPA: NADH-quinone oxidoreductase subunit K [Gaiellaceae bacterium]|nr:NADH-quinone oxidoreductase subunit K [Gaiellaceae bacterium]